MTNSRSKDIAAVMGASISASHDLHLLELAIRNIDGRLTLLPAKKKRKGIKLLGSKTTSKPKVLVYMRTGRAAAKRVHKKG